MTFHATVIHKLDRTIMRALNEQVSKFGLSAAQVLVLDAMEDGNSTPSDIAQATGLDPASISSTLKALQCAGVIARKTDLDDLRSVRILFTKKGDQLFNKIKSFIKEPFMKHYYCPECGGLDFTPHECRTEGCPLKNRELVECNCDNPRTHQKEAIDTDNATADN